MKKRAIKISKIVVIDGDTFRCDFADETHTIRLYDVEAPKVHEPFNEELTKELEKLILRKNIALDVRGESWGELDCIVRVEGESKSVNDRIRDSLIEMREKSPPIKSVPRHIVREREIQRRRMRRA